jgi:hypothetical protein
MSQSLASSAARAARGRSTQITPPGVPTARPARPGRAGRPNASPRPSVRRPPLRVVQAPPTAGSPLGFAVVCAALLGAGLIALLLLNTAVAQNSFGLQHLQARSQQLADQKQALIQSNDVAAAPAQLATRAWAMGLVPAGSAGFVRLPSGQVVGVANPAVRSQPPTVITSTTRTSTTSASRPAAPVVRAGPVLAPASPVATTAGSGTAPGLAPAPPVASGQTGPTAKPQARTTR